MSGNYCKRLSVGGWGGLSDGSHFWMIAPIVQVMMPVESYSASFFQTTQK